MPAISLRLRLLAGGAVVLALVLFAFPGLRYVFWGWLSGEPFANGRPRCYWVRMLDDPEPWRHEYAALMLADLGTHAAPAKERLAWVVENATSSRTRDAAARALGNLGPEAADAVPALIRAFRDSSSRYYRQPLAWALARIAGSEDGRIPEPSSYVLADIRAELIAGLEGDSSAIRDGCQEALQLLGEKACQVLEDGLVHRSAEVRSRCATVLGRIGGGEARHAIPKLEELAKSDPDGFVRRWAQWALRNLE